MLVGVEENVSFFCSFCQQIFGCATREGSRAGVIEGDGTGEMSAIDIGGIDVAFDGVVEGCAISKASRRDRGTEGVTFIDGGGR